MTAAALGTDRLSGPSESALAPLVARAAAAERFPDIGFRDRTAEAICKALELDLVSGYREGHLTSLGVISRSWVIDQLVGVFTSHHPGAQIVDLGCGLSTTFERIDNGMLSWIDVDLPAVVALRQTLFPFNNRRRMIAADVAAPGWLDRLELAAKPTMVVADGLFMYLPPAVVHRVIDDLAAGVSGRPCELVFDYVHPVAVGRTSLVPFARLGRRVPPPRGAAYTWGVRRRELAPAQSGWQLLRNHPVYERVGFPYTLMSRLFRRIAGGYLHGIAHLTRTAAPRRDARPPEG